MSDSPTSKLPDNWCESTIGETCQVVSGSTPKTRQAEFWGGEISWLTPDDLSKNRSKIVARGARSITQAGYESCSTRLVPTGSVLFTSRAPIGYVAIAGRELCTNQGFKSAVPGEALTSEFLYWQLQHVTDEIRSRASGTTFLEISGKGFAATGIVVPPLAEQEKIVEVLEEQVSRLDAALVSMRTVGGKAAQFRRSLLYAAFTSGFGYVKEDAFTRRTIGDLATLENGDRGQNYPSKSTLAAKGVPFVNAGHLEAGRINIGIVSYITEDHYAILRSGKFRKGDILFCLRGSLGKCAFVSEDVFGAIASSLVIVRANSEISEAYLFHYLNSPLADDEMRRYDNGTAQPNLASKDLAKFFVPVVPLDVQNKIVADLEAQLSRLKASLAVVEAVEERSTALRRSLLHSAFTGELTAEWRESAHV